MFGTAHVLVIYTKHVGTDNVLVIHNEYVGTDNVHIYVHRP